MKVENKKDSGMFDFVQMEEAILQKWQEIKLYDKIQSKKDLPLYVFLEGPPTANCV